jgi:hypothetical protein
VDFEEALERLGFVTADERTARGVRLYEAHPNRFLTCWVHAYPDGTALMTWEFAIADYVATRGIQVGSNESLNTYLYPREDLRGPQDSAWLASALDGVEESLRALRFDDPEA